MVYPEEEKDIYEDVYPNYGPRDVIACPGIKFTSLKDSGYVPVKEIFSDSSKSNCFWKQRFLCKETSCVGCQKYKEGD